MGDCKNRIGERCRLNGEVCPHLVYDGKCERASCDEMGSVTFQTALDIKLAAVINKKCRRNLLGALKVVLAKTGLQPDDSVERFDYRTAAKFVEDARAKYSPVTISSMVGAVYSFGDRKLRAEYERRGMRLPVFDKVSVEVPKKVITEMTWEQVRAVEDHMRVLRAKALAGDATAKDEFVYFWFGYWFGVRPGDICRMKWSAFQSLNGIPHLCFTTHKTGADIVEPIPTDAYNEIKPFIGASEDYCISRHAEKRNGNWREENEVGGHRSLRARINRFMRSIGIAGWGAFYRLRERMAQLTYRAHGEEAEAAKLGHSPTVAKRHYYNGGDRRIKI